MVRAHVRWVAFAALPLPAMLVGLIAGTRTTVLDGGGTAQILHLQAVNNHGPTVMLNGLTLPNGKAVQSVVALVATGSSAPAGSPPGMPTVAPNPAPAPRTGP